jgi:hypothetical protein
MRLGQANVLFHGTGGNFILEPVIFKLSFLASSYFRAAVGMAVGSLIGNASGGQPIDLAHQLEVAARALHVLHEPQHARSVLYGPPDDKQGEDINMAGWPVIRRALRYSQQKKEEQVIRAV